MSMSPLLRLEALSWDTWNLDHITKHEVSVGEILESLDNIVEGKVSYKGRYQVFGTTQRGRVLSIILGPVPGQTSIWYVFSARSASRKERAYLEADTGDVNP